MQKRLMSQAIQQMVFTGPAALLFAVIVALPFSLGVYYSMTNWNGVSGKVDWVGLDNFIAIFTQDPVFLSSLWFTIRFALVVLVVQNVVGFSLAYLLSKQIISRNLLRTVFFMPNVLGGIILGFIWQFIFIQSFPSIGKITQIGFFNWNWLGTEATAFMGLVLVAVWQGAGYIMVIYIAGISNVPKDLLEAAKIDGATSWTILTRMIVPLLMPTITVCLFFTLSTTFKMFDLNFSLTRGGPFNSSESVALNIYMEAFDSNRLGLGSAKALIFFLFVMLVSALQVSITRRREVDM